MANLLVALAITMIAFYLGIRLIYDSRKDGITGLPMVSGYILTSASSALFVTTLLLLILAFAGIHPGTPKPPPEHNIELLKHKLGEHPQVLKEHLAPKFKEHLDRQLMETPELRENAKERLRERLRDLEELNKESEPLPPEGESIPPG
ncbi:MAG: hypothetical protein DRH51_03745 [Candidatus Coatesbacteria bacterium]|nr:MAG: hypothetical protein DRH51_03745 [Candidatus Coatesbacteria bacterium]